MLGRKLLRSLACTLLVVFTAVLVQRAVPHHCSLDAMAPAQAGTTDAEVVALCPLCDVLAPVFERSPAMEPVLLVASIVAPQPVLAYSPTQGHRTFLPLRGPPAA